MLRLRTARHTVVHLFFTVLCFEPEDLEHDTLSVVPSFDIRLGVWRSLELESSKPDVRPLNTNKAHQISPLSFLSNLLILQSFRRAKFNGIATMNFSHYITHHLTGAKVG